MFTADNKFVRMVGLQSADDEEQPGDLNPLAMMEAASTMQDMFGGAVLPAASIARAAERAREIAKPDSERVD